MSKLCTLKNMVPGSVLEHEGNHVIVMDLDYHPTSKSIRPFILKHEPSGQFSITALPAIGEDTEFVVSDDKSILEQARMALGTQNLAVPMFGMSMGADPELFVVHKDGTVFPAWEFLPDEEKANLKSAEWMLRAFDNNGNNTGSVWAVPDSNWAPKRCPAYWDGVQAEIAPWAKSCLEIFHEGTRKGLQAVLAFARKVDPEAKLTIANVVEMPDNVLKNAESKFIQFRCSESYNVYEDIGGGIPDARQYKYRCSGGHIHFGFSRVLTAPTIEQIVRGLDGVLGVIGVSLAARFDNPERRKTYGRAGEFRLPKHGIEYRVLSNFWLSHPAMAMLVFELARGAERFAESGLFNACWMADEQETRDVINYCDAEGARKILNRNLPTIAGILQSMWTKEVHGHSPAMRKLALRAILHGMESVIPDPYDIEGNWDLDGKTWLTHCRAHNWLTLTKEFKL